MKGPVAPYEGFTTPSRTSRTSRSSSSGSVFYIPPTFWAIDWASIHWDSRPVGVRHLSFAKLRHEHEAEARTRKLSLRCSPHQELKD
eukprot:6482224-Amphidinium_carterae.1